MASDEDDQRRMDGLRELGLSITVDSAARIRELREELSRLRAALQRSIDMTAEQLAENKRLRAESMLGAVEALRGNVGSITEAIEARLQDPDVKRRSAAAQGLWAELEQQETVEAIASWLEKQQAAPQGQPGETRLCCLRCGATMTVTRTGPLLNRDVMLDGCGRCEDSECRASQAAAMRGEKAKCP